MNNSFEEIFITSFLVLKEIYRECLTFNSLRNIHTVNKKKVMQKIY